MIRVYINYPKPHMTIHNDPNCSEFQKHGKPNQRLIQINMQNISVELPKFRNRSGNIYKFNSRTQYRDMWLEIDFGDIFFEIDLYRYIRRLLCGRYRKHFRNCPEILHC